MRIEAMIAAVRARPDIEVDRKAPAQGQPIDA